jgi:trehalose 2-sulfotransferase
MLGELQNQVKGNMFYIIAFTLRSGSNLLCDYLFASGLGQPTEYFQYPYGVANRGHYTQLDVPSDDFKLYFSRLLTHRALNGYFGVKLTWDQKNVLLEEARQHFGEICGLSDLFPDTKWIYLRRRDKVAQALSLWRAIKSGQWFSSAEVTGDLYPEYDFFKIFSLFFTLLVEEYLWDEYFHSEHVEPAMIFYEDLISNPQAILADLMEFLRGANGLASISNEANIQIIQNLSIQRDQYSEEIRAQFVEDLDHLGVSPYWQSREVQLKRWLEFFGEGLWKQ